MTARNRCMGFLQSIFDLLLKISCVREPREVVEQFNLPEEVHLRRLGFRPNCRRIPASCLFH